MDGRLGDWLALKPPWHWQKVGRHHSLPHAVHGLTGCPGGPLSAMNAKLPSGMWYQLPTAVGIGGTPDEWGIQ